MFARKSDLEHLERKFDVFVKSMDTRLEVYKTPPTLGMTETNRKSCWYGKESTQPKTSL